MKAKHKDNNDIVGLILEQNKFILQQEKLDINDNVSTDRRDNFIPRHCTFEQTGYKQVQHNKCYRCKTCMCNYSICEECAKVCHKGHQVISVGSEKCFADAEQVISRPHVN